MPKLSGGHANSTLITFSDFSGGLNFIQPPESIAENELQEAVNFEFAPDTGMLRVRGGLLLAYTFEDTVTDLMPIAGTDELLVRSGDSIYRLAYRHNNDSTAGFVGTVDGNKRGSYELWSDGHQMLMTFGGSLYIYNGMALDKVETEGAPTAAEILFVRNGRVIVSEADSDTIRYSGVGDATNWKTGTDADSLSVDIGYKDGCKMKAISTMAGELIIFKAPDGLPEHGRIYRLQGDYPNWQVIHHSRGASTWNPNAVTTISNDIVFLTREGLGSLSTATEFGDYKLGWAGAKINPRMAKGLTERCRLWSLPIKGQVWVSDGQNDDIWNYHYQVGKGAWTILRFPGKLNAVATSGGYVYVAIGNIVYRIDDTNARDGGAIIQASLKPKTLFRKNQTLVKSVIVGYQSTSSSEAKFKIERFELPLPTGGQGDIAFMDDDLAITDSDPLVMSTTMSATVRRRCNIRRWSITPEISVRDGFFSLSFMGLEIAEV